MLFAPFSFQFCESVLLLHMFKNSRLYSILFNKCPRCHKGLFFTEKNPYKLSRFDKLHPCCSHCKEDFVREVGFYYGAMYVSYGLAVGFGIGLFLLMVVWAELSVVPFLICYSVLILLLSPWIFRKSRLVWINLFVGFKPEAMASDKKEEATVPD